MKGLRVTSRVHSQEDVVHNSLLLLYQQRNLPSDMQQNPISSCQMRLLVIVFIAFTVKINQRIKNTFPCNLLCCNAENDSKCGTKLQGLKKT